jgi:cellulose synthase/poly-beta-1,6-N-acetylglucosamine synthase-like glycosyltransferase
VAKPFATVLLDTYNHEAFIEKAILSVLQQDFPASETEILVVDDGSSDRTTDILEKFAPRVRLLRKRNGGQASAFNAGIPEAQGKIVAFLDGDDWWAHNKLSAVAGVFAAEPAVGLVGHGVTEVSLDNAQRTEIPREICRFRIRSVVQAKTFRMQRGFFGTSRMAYRREILGEIGPTPETLRFEADEYLFTLAALLTDVTILDQPLTFYRLHAGNLFQIAARNAEGVQNKRRILEALVDALELKMKSMGVSEDIARTILETIQIEADVLRLVVDSGFPWETVATELKVMRVFHSDASLWQHLFSCARLLPALVMPAASYYRWRHRISRLDFYKALRQRFMPFPVPSHVERREKPAPPSHL